MISSKFVRYCAYLILGVIILLGIKEIFTTYFWFERDIANLSFEKEMEKQDLKNKNDNIFNIDIDNLINLKKYDVVIGKLNSKIKSLPTDKYLPTDKSMLLSQIGDVYQYKGDINSAFKNYSEAILLDDSNVNAHVKRGEINLYFHKLDDAINDYKAAANNNFDYYYILGVLQAKKGDKKSAIASLDSCLKFYPKTKGCKIKIDSLKLLK